MPDLKFSTAPPAAALDGTELLGCTQGGASSQTTTGAVAGLAASGPGSSTDKALARFNGTTGKLLQNGVVLESDAGGLSAITQLDVDNLRLDGNTVGSTDTNGNVVIDPAGSGRICFGGATSSDPAFSILSSFGGSPGLRCVTGSFSGGAALVASLLAVPDDSTPKVYVDNSGVWLASSAQLGARAGSAANSGTQDVGMVRDSAGTWRDTNASSGIGARLCSRPVEANTAGSGSPNLLLATESRKLLTNEGSTAENYHTLPSAAAGMEFQFFCQDSDGIRIVANAGNTIRIESTVSASAGFIRSAVVGSGITLAAINATEWVAVNKPAGTWTVDI